VLVAIRDRETAAAALGVNVGYYKIMIFAFTSAIVSMVGCLNGYYFKYVSYDGYTLFLAVMYLSMTIVGGMGSLFGCYLGAFFLTLLPYALVEIFAVVPVPGSFLRYSFAVQYVLYGLLIMVFLIYEPTGLAGIWGRIRSFFEFWPFRYRKGTNISE
jgi:branched-chain amino acid transport system permease protein